MVIQLIIFKINYIYLEEQQDLNFLKICTSTIFLQIHGQNCKYNFPIMSFNQKQDINIAW